MGGIGSGRQRCWFVGGSTDDYLAIDVRRWNREGLLAPPQSFIWQWKRQGEVRGAIRVHTEPGHTEPGRMILTHHHRSGGEDWQDASYSVDLDWTDCNLGRKRPWFLCPVRGCGRRVAILYGDGIFACRRCYRLTYPCQREVDYNRMARRANKLRDKLGWEPGFLNGPGGKPKGMHGRTFERLMAQHDAFVQSALARIAARYPLMDYFPGETL